ncbi:ribonuclease P protein subunit p25-like protein [Watersipora subatra]|uniref:ribonuclease P protein subunit p25-like protein n=1 Tax=Watersipora subatra TaxID=2589382 RepID=UPI00355B6F7C
MDHYQLGEIRVVEANLFYDVKLDENLVHMNVQGKSYVRNLLGFAINKMKAADVNQILWHGEGATIRKAINCAQIMKRKQRNLYMLTRKGFNRVEEYWEPIHNEAGLDRLKVNKDTDAVAILLSKTPLDRCEHEEGYLGIGEMPPKPTAEVESRSKTVVKAKEGSNRKKVNPKSQQKPNNFVQRRTQHGPLAQSQKRTQTQSSCSKS